jgi:hypothetical protein
MASIFLRVFAAIVVSIALSCNVMTAQAAMSGHRPTAPPSSASTQVKPSLETCAPGQHCTGMPQKKCTTEYVAVCHRHHAVCQTVEKTVCL